MNFLAHIYLSGDDHQLMIGNFIGDFVKGKKKDDYPSRIRQGIELHRAIDDYTDHHEITGKSKDRLRKNYGKYSGVITDLYYDHFLASGFSKYHVQPLEEFSIKTYGIIKENWEVLPEGVHFFFPYMVERNWLLNYATIDGIGRTLTGLSKRVSFENKMDESVNDLKEHYKDFENDFKEFFPDLIRFVNEKLSNDNFQI